MEKTLQLTIMNTQQKNLKEILKDIFYPSYDESSIFLMNFIFLLLFSFNQTCRSEILNFYRNPGYGDSRGLVLILIATVLFISGILTSIYHAFSKSEKDMMSETLMKFSAMLVNGVAGITCGLYLLENNIRWLIIFPAWNILMGVVLLYQIGLIENINFDQTDASFSQVITGVIISGGAVLFFNNICNYYWAVTFSLCVIYVVGINHYLSQESGLLFKRIIANK